MDIYNNKIIKKLPMPKDSAWDRNSWKNYLPVWFLEFLRGVKNLIDWFSVIFNDRHWDSNYIFEVLKRKIELQRKYIVTSNRHSEVERDNRDMTLCLNLIQRVQEDFYSIEYSDYEKTEYNFLDIPGDTENKTLDIKIVHEDFDSYFKKYPLSYKKVLSNKKLQIFNIKIGEEENTVEIKQRIAMNIGHYNQQKAHSLLFKILNERMSWWWD